MHARRSASDPRRVRREIADGVMRAQLDETLLPAEHGGDEPKVVGGKDEPSGTFTSSVFMVFNSAVGTGTSPPAAPAQCRPGPASPARPDAAGKRSIAERVAAAKAAAKAAKAARAAAVAAGLVDEVEDDP